MMATRNQSNLPNLNHAMARVDRLIRLIRLFDLMKFKKTKTNRSYRKCIRDTTATATASRRRRRAGRSSSTAASPKTAGPGLSLSLSLSLSPSTLMALKWTDFGSRRVSFLLLRLGLPLDAESSFRHRWVIPPLSVGFRSRSSFFLIHPLANCKTR